MRLSSSVAGKVWRVCQGSLAMDHAFCAAMWHVSAGALSPPPPSFSVSLFSPPTHPDRLHTYNTITDSFFLQAGACIYKIELHFAWKLSTIGSLFLSLSLCFFFFFFSVFPHLFFICFFLWCFVCVLTFCAGCCRRGRYFSLLSLYLFLLLLLPPFQVSLYLFSF